MSVLLLLLWTSHLAPFQTFSGHDENDYYYFFLGEPMQDKIILLFKYMEFACASVSSIISQTTFNMLFNCVYYYLFIYCVQEDQLTNNIYLYLYL